MVNNGLHKNKTEVGLNKILLIKRKRNMNMNSLAE
jgi:hypothetical protein